MTGASSGLTRLVIIEKRSDEAETQNRTYKEDKVNEFYSMCKMKNKHSDDKQSPDYILFEKLFECLRAFNSLLNRFTERGIIPKEKFVRALEFGTRLSHKEGNPNQAQAKENIRDIEGRIRLARKDLDKWKGRKEELLKDPHALPNFISLQMLGKSLIKLGPENFRFYVKFLEKDLRLPDEEDGEKLAEDHSFKKTEGRLEVFLKFFRDNKAHLSEVFEQKTTNGQQLKYLKFVELDIKDAYNYVLNQVHAAKEELAADQVLFCSWHLKWAELESRLTRVCVPVGLRPAAPPARAV